MRAGIDVSSRIAGALAPRGAAITDGVGEEQASLAGLLRGALVVSGAALFFTSLDIFAFEALAAPRPTYWVYGYCAGAVALVLLQPERPTGVLRSPLVLWLALFLAVTLAWAIGMRTAPRAVQELVDRLRSMAFLAACILVFDAPRARRLGVAAVAAGVVAVSLLNLAELLRVVELPNLLGFPRVPGRAGAFYGDSNADAQCLALGLAVVLPAVPRRWRGPLLIAGGAGIAATFSRSGVVCLAILIAWLLVRGLLGRGQLALAAAGAVVLLWLGVEYLAANDLLTDNTAERLAGDADDNGRIRLARYAWEAFASSPLLGNGLGSTNVWQAQQMAHNMFLTLAADYGVLGLLAFPALGAALVLTGRTAGGFALVLMAAGMFSHTLIDGRPYAFLVALAAAGAARTPGTAGGEEAACACSR